VISRFFDISRWRSYAILDLFSAFLDHPRSIFGRYWCEKFGWNPFSSFDNIKISIFRTFSLKLPIHAPKCFFAGFDPLNGEVYQLNFLHVDRTVYVLVMNNKQARTQGRFRGLKTPPPLSKVVQKGPISASAYLIISVDICNMC